MGKPILYGFIASPPVRTCLLTAAAINLDVEFREIDAFKKEHLSPEFLKKNPLHTLPTLEVDGKFICDSHAIITYLVAKYSKDDSLYPKDLLQKALVDQKLYFEASLLAPRLRLITTPVIRKQRSTIPQELLVAVEEAYGFLEHFLTESKFVAGDNLTVADFSIIASINSGRLLVPICSKKFPKISAWIKKIESLPYYEEKCGKGGKMLEEYVKKTLAELQAANL